MRRPEIWIAAGVSLVVSLVVAVGLPGLQGLNQKLNLAGKADFLSDMPILASAGMFKQAAAPSLGEEVAFCEPDVETFAAEHKLADLGLGAYEPPTYKDSPADGPVLSETTILTPSRMNTYSLTEAPEHFVGYFAQRGSFVSAITNEVAHIEVLSTFILQDSTIARRTVSDSIQKGSGPTQGIFHIDYRDAGSVTGSWSGRTDRSGKLQGCFQFPPTLIDGRTMAGIGRYTQVFDENDSAVVTWQFDALFSSDIDSESDIGSDGL